MTRLQNLINSKADELYSYDNLPMEGWTGVVEREAFRAGALFGLELAISEINEETVLLAVLEEEGK